MGSRYQKYSFALILILLLLPAMLHAELTVDQQERAAQRSLWSPLMYEQFDEGSFLAYTPFHWAIDLNEIDYPLLHAALFFESNRVRVRHGLPALGWNLNLEITAYNHSLFMVEQYEFAHYSGNSERRSPGDRGRLAGILNPQMQENLGINFALDYQEGRRFYVHGNGLFSYDNDVSHAFPVLTYYEFARRAVELWMASFGHRRNLLNERAVQLGTGAFFFREANSGYFPKFRTTQNFQWYNPVQAGESFDPLPPGYRVEDLPLMRQEETGHQSGD